MTHDLWANVIGRGSEETEATTAKIASVVISVLRDPVHAGVGSGFNVSVLVAMAFVFAASANFPTLVLRSGGGGSTPPARSRAWCSASSPRS